MNRRHLLRIAAGIPFIGGMFGPMASARAAPRSRVRPGDPGWPSQDAWDVLGRDVGGRLTKVQPPFAACLRDASDPACADLFKELKNPYFLGDEVGLTQSLGWVDAWTSQPSAYAVAAESTADVVAAVNFARNNNLRLVVKGGGHSYYGQSNAPDSLLIWTRKMNAITLHDDFVGAGCAGTVAPQKAVSVQAGAIWRQVYDKVMVGAGRYVQGGGCMTVGVAGFIQGGGFGSSSRRYGIGAGSLLEAEVVTADGEVRIANACTNPDLFWGLKGGGANLGVITRLTLRTHELAPFYGAVFTVIKAKSDDAFQRLIGKFVDLYAEQLFNPHWGEQVGVRPGGVLTIAMVFQGLTQQEAEAVWRPFFDWVAATPQDYETPAPPKVFAGPGRSFWDHEALKRVPGLIASDDRPGAPPENIFWATNRDETGRVWHGYQSLWLPASLLDAGRRGDLAKALFEAAKYWGATLHMNKALAGASSEAREAAKETALNPAVLDAFALVISAAGEQPAYPGVAGHEPNVEEGRRHAEAIDKAMNELRKVAPNAGAYVLEANYFEPDWRESFWGSNYPRLRAVKDKYDPDGLFFSRHGVGSEDWSADGFTRAS
jgi:FAD/FMN-containing dehydrogenase